MTGEAAQEKPAPLRGLRILDLTRVLSGPYCTLTLADLGADVIKVENTEHGDDTRKFVPPDLHGHSTYFLTANRNKRSLALDLKSEAGAKILIDLAKKCEVLVENFRPGVMDRLGLGYEVLKQHAPDLIYCAISGYGQTGSQAGDPGFDPVVQAESGLMSMTGEPDGDPMRTGISFVDMFTGLYAAQAISAAIINAERNAAGGQYIEVSLFEAGLNMLANFAGMQLITGENPTRIGNGNQVSQPVGVFQASDGGFMIAVANDVQFRRLCVDVLGYPDMADDPRFQSPADRNNNKVQLCDRLNELFAIDRRANWVTRLKQAGVPAGEIRTVEEAFKSDIVRERDLIKTAPHETLGEYPYLASPIRLPGTQAVEPMGAPLLGQHSEEVLANLLGYEADKIRDLFDQGVIAQKAGN
jgi:crotonobetainyl-CoA:carnitine CoA-transferase CaiB-like acyl-CoA transferase